MAEDVPAPPSGAWTGRNIAVVVALLVITNAVTGVAVFFATPQAPGTQAIVVYHAWSGSERDLFLPVIDDFTERTGIQVTDRTFRQETLQTILPSQFAAGQTPADVIFHAPGFIREFGIAGHAMDVTALIDNTKYSDQLAPVTEGAILYGAANTAKVKPGFWYKDSFFTTNAYDKNPQNYAEFTALLADIMADGTVPIVSGDGVGWPLSDVTEHFIATYGGAQMHRDLVSGAKAFTDADVKAIFTDYLVPLLQAGYFDTLTEWTQGVSDLDDEKNAMYFQGSWLPTMSQTSDETDMRALALPGGVANQGVVYATDYFFIPTYTTKVAEAQAFLQYLISPAGQEKQIEQGGHFATHVDADPTVAPPTYSGDLIAGKDKLFDLDDALPDLQPTFWAQLQLLWGNPNTDLDTLLATIEGAR